MKDIKEYLHLYLGCQCMLYLGEGEPDQKVRLSIYNLNYYKNTLEDLKPILRPLSDMTEEEGKQYTALGFGGFPIMKQEQKIIYTTFTPPCFLWLLKSSFDLFGLIESGLAIDKTKI